MSAIRRARAVNGRHNFNHPAKSPPPPPEPWAIVKAAGTVIAPLSVVTALMYYFGLLHAYWFFASFGVDYTLFNLTAEDYILRSADGLFVPLAITASVALTGAWVHTLLKHRIEPRSQAAIALKLAVICTIAGSLLLSLAIFALANPNLFVRWPGTGGIALTVAVLLLLAAMHLKPRPSELGGQETTHQPNVPWLVTEWTATLVLVSIGLFWAVGDWSAAVGTKRAAEVVRALPAWPNAILYSERSLALEGAGITETRCADDDGVFAFRYDGLKLILNEGDQMFFLPGEWSSDEGTAVVITRTSSLRLEFTAPSKSLSFAC